VCAHCLHCPATLPRGVLAKHAATQQAAAAGTARHTTQIACLPEHAVGTSAPSPLPRALHHVMTGSGMQG
jgi:hypothetical protein